MAHQESASLSCAHLDLDTIAWADAADAPKRMALEQSRELIEQFLHDNENWVIEGCYADLLAIVIPSATKVIFLNPGIETCIANCKNRPWEPHKYASPEAQDANLDMLITWIKQYEHRVDEFSLRAHQKLFQNFTGEKDEYKSNMR